MASLVLGIAGQAIGPSLFGAGFSVFGATITGAEIGGAIGAFIGSEIDSLIAPGSHVTPHGPAPDRHQHPGLQRGRADPASLWPGARRRPAHLGQPLQGNRRAPPPRAAARAARRVTVTQTDYSYSMSFAVGLCEGVITGLGRVWADGNLIDLSQATPPGFIPATKTQSPDPLIEEIEGAGNAPAWRGLAYIVFEDLPLAKFGNRIPQLQFEVIRAISADNPDALENRLAGVALIPGAGRICLRHRCRHRR